MGSSVYRHIALHNSLSKNQNILISDQSPKYINNISHSSSPPNNVIPNSSAFYQISQSVYHKQYHTIQYHYKSTSQTGCTSRHHFTSSTRVNDCSTLISLYFSFKFTNSAPHTSHYKVKPTTQCTNSPCCTKYITMLVFPSTSLIPIVHVFKVNKFVPIHTIPIYL